MSNAWAAQMLQEAIHDAICSENSINACRWLYLNEDPTFAEIHYPDLDSFIGICKELSLNWRELRESLIESLRIQHREKIGLRLVQSSEQCYNRINETGPYSNRARPIKRRKRKLYLQTLQTAPRSSQAYSER